MKTFRKIILALGATLFCLGVYAQSDNPYLDDAYLSQKDIEVRNARAKAEATARYQAALEAQKRYEAEQKQLIEAYKKRQREFEIDAYNGQLSQEHLGIHSDDYKQGPSRNYQVETEVNIYGPYSERLARFHSNGAVIVSSPGSYTEYDYAPGRTTLSLHLGSNSWYTPFYPSGGYWNYYSHPHYWYPRAHWGWRNHWDWRWDWRWDYYNHYYYSPWLWGYHGGYYDRAYDYYEGYYRGLADRARYKHYYRNKYAHGSRSPRSSYSRESHSSSYEAYDNARAFGHQRGHNTTPNVGNYNSSGNYQSSSSGRSYGGSIRYQTEARLPQSNNGYNRSETYNSSNDRGYSRSSSGSNSTSGYSGRSERSSSTSSSNGEASSSRNSGGVRARHR